jgi:hypothetical protein
LIFDRGVNSEINIGDVADKMHIVGSISRAQAKDYYKIPLHSFNTLYTNQKNHAIKGCRFDQISLFDKTFCLVVTYNGATHKRQKKTYEKRKSFKVSKNYKKSKKERKK